MSIKKDKAYYTLITADCIYRNCSWAFAEKNASVGDRLITIKNGLLHHERVYKHTSQYTEEWEELHRDDKDWYDMSLYKRKRD
tara:strand:- start:279 stop:527 length:249 start_codon:yes stop_codon:yes gene_type:complete